MPNQSPRQTPSLLALTSRGVRLLLLPLEVAPAVPAPTLSWWIQFGGSDHRGVRVGRINLRIQDARGEVDFAVEESQRGHGYASAAVRAVTAWALDREGAGLAAVLWRAEVGNWAARRVVWSCGFRVEGRVRGLLSDPDGRRDGWIGALLPGEEQSPLLAWLDPPVVALGEVLLRPHEPPDADRIVSACSDPLARRYIEALPDPYTRRDAEDFMLFAAEEHASASGLHWVIAGVEEPELLLGQIALMGLRSGLSRFAEIGYWMHPDARRNGYCRTALRAVARHALLPAVEGGLGLDRVFLRAAETNEGSLRVARSAGFTETGRDRDTQLRPDGTLEDHLRFDLIAPELDDLWAHPSALR